jgi:hypothetical protein
LKISNLGRLIGAGLLALCLYAIAPHTAAVEKAATPAAAQRG